MRTIGEIHAGMTTPERDDMRARIRKTAINEAWLWSSKRVGRSRMCNEKDHSLCVGESHSQAAGCLCECHDQLT